MATGWRFENTYALLPDALHAPAAPAPVREPHAAILNYSLAADLGLELTAGDATVFAGQTIPDGATPIAQAYAGHQFGHFTMLGDGRAILFGEHRTPDARLLDIQLKGAGRTRFSRGGDGLAALGPMLREYVISEAMAGLGIPTTRSLAVVTTGDVVRRVLPQKGAILTRVAASHIRVGTFEYAAAIREPDTLRALADYAIARHYPDIADGPRKYLDFFRAVADRQAALIARWQLVGFIHGVMNTDNVAVSGESIDYGPCAFMNAYDPDTVFSSIDRDGRYAYGNQPRITQWNLARFAESLLTLLAPDSEAAVAAATEVLEAFPASFERYWLNGVRRKLGLRGEDEGDEELARSLLEWMQKTRADFTNTFRDLAEGRVVGDDEWRSRWLKRDPDFGLMLTTNPAVIARNHRVEEALAAAEERDDLTVLHRLLEALRNPFEGRPEQAAYREVPPDDAGYRTFCGT